MLTDAKIKAAKPKAAAYKLSDANQLYLYVAPTGTRTWRMNYTYGANKNGKPAQKTLTIGPYPSVTLLDARQRRDQAKQILREGLDPSVERRTETDARAQANRNTFQLIGEKWFELKSGWNISKLRAWIKEHDGKFSAKDVAHWRDRATGTWSPIHSKDVWHCLERDVFPGIGKMPITSIEAPKVLELLQEVQGRGAIETGLRARQRISDIFVYGIATGVAKSDPAASLGKALEKKPRRRKQPSIIDGVEDTDEQIRLIRKVVADCEAERCRAATKLALRFIALTAVRPNELHGAAWDELHDLKPRFGIRRGETVQINEPVWVIPAERMKGDEERKLEEFGEHRVPLSRQALELIEVLRPLTGGYRYMFPSERHVHQTMSDGTLRALLMRAGYYKKHVPHGFRAAFSTIMNGRPKAEDGRHDGDRAVIDLMLAHVPKDKVEGAYNRAGYMPRRRELAQQWADILLQDVADPASFVGQPIRHAVKGPRRPREADGD